MITDVIWNLEKEREERTICYRKDAPCQFFGALSFGLMQCLASEVYRNRWGEWM